MSMNPSMYNERTPFAVSGELFLVSRPSLYFELQAEGLPKVSASNGTVFLTTKRLVFVAEPAVKQRDGFMFQAFEIPLEKIADEKFNQPIFGSNNLAGTVKPVPGMGLNTDAKYKLYFNAGGAGTFLPLFFRALIEARRPAQHSLAQVILQNQFAAVAVQDPSDPSTIFLQQPDIPVATPVPVPAGASAGTGHIPSAKVVQ
uniref:GRAM domain-containing protein n=1 Tax=Mucochytrium quahogii TaxID=96639 RepID=A0A7S2S2S8_9STRA|mmetsp:Transcript_43986/g.70421  ORF Transcript_43986/g.70421 Transcript_43986/m.70421 type:complete len:201 (-) Transcript_43986:2028-2630(-)